MFFLSSSFSGIVMKYKLQAKAQGGAIISGVREAEDQAAALHGFAIRVVVSLEKDAVGGAGGIILKYRTRRR